jgi:hypothetical protein
MRVRSNTLGRPNETARNPDDTLVRPHVIGLNDVLGNLTKDEIFAANLGDLVELHVGLIITPRRSEDVSDLVVVLVVPAFLKSLLLALKRRLTVLDRLINTTLPLGFIAKAVVPKGLGLLSYEANTVRNTLHLITPDRQVGTFRNHRGLIPNFLGDVGLTREGETSSLNGFRCYGVRDLRCTRGVASSDTKSEFVHTLGGEIKRPSC